MWKQIAVLWIALLNGLCLASSAMAENIAFSPEEQQFIDQQLPITVVADLNFYPYAFVNDSGAYDGISREYLEEIAQLTGINFTYKIGPSWAEMLQGLKDGEIDIIPMMFYDQDKTDYVQFSQPYILHSEYLYTLETEPNIQSLDAIANKTLAVIEGYELTSWLKLRYPNIKLKYYDELSHCLRAVADGEVFGTIGELSSTLYFKNKMHLRNIKKNTAIAGRKNLPISIGLGTQHSHLLTIINKAIEQIDIATRNRISGRWLNDSSSQSILNGAFGYGRAPFMYDLSSEVGLEYEIVRRVLSSMGYQIEDVEQLPTFRGQIILHEDQNLDFSVGVSELPDNMFYSDDIVNFNNVAVTRKVDNIALSSPADMADYSVSSFADSRKLLGEEYAKMASNSSRFKEHSVQELSLTEFFAGNADVLVADIEIVKWAIRYSGLTNGLISDFEFHPIFDQSEVGYKVAFRNQHIRDLFNQALQTLRSGEEYQQLIDLYLNSNFNPQIRRGNLIADVVAPYIFHDDLKNLRSVLRVFHKNSNIKAISVSSDSPNRVIMQLQEIDGELKSVDVIKVSHLSRLSKESFYVHNGSTDKVGSITFYAEANTPEQIISSHVPDLRQFSGLSGEQMAEIRLAYERQDLSGQLLNLSDAEQVWIGENPIISIAVDPAALPYEAFDEDGQYIGAVADYLQLISASTGLVFEPVKVETWQESLKLIRSRKVQLASAAFGNTELELDYLTTLPIAKSEVSYVGRIGEGFVGSLSDLRGKTVGIIKGASQTAALTEQSPDVNWVYPQSSEIGMQQVADGEIDGMVDTILVLNYLMQSRGYSNLAVTGDFDRDVASTIYVLKTLPTLQSIISKAIDAVTQAQRDAIVSKWVPNKVIERVDYTLVWQVVAAALFLVVLALFWNRKLASLIKAREKAEQRLQEREQLLFDMLNSAPIGVAIVANEQTLFSNKTGRDMFGVSAEELDDFKVSNIYCDPAQRDQSYQMLKQGLPVVNQEIDFKRTDGKQFTGLANYINTEFKDQPAILFWCYDISELKDLNTQLSLAIDEADNANKAKSDFLANMSHEIRTPMNAIIGMTHLALNAELDRKTRGYLNKVSHAAASLLGIINDILDFSKIEAGKLDMECLDISIQDILQNQLNLIELKAQDKGVEVLTLVEPSVPHNLMGDPLRLGQIFTNLASNAIKFTEQGEIAFSVKLLEQQTNRAKLQFSVRDTGIGISPEQQQKLFQSFTQADASTTRQYGGTGLGLTICKSLVELMEGEIWLESTLGEGTEFLFTAWFKLNHERPAKRSAISPTSLDNMCILVVDDNESAAEIMASIVSSFGPEVSVVHAGSEAQALVAENPDKYDVAIVDWNMPDMDGVATCEAIRQEAGSHPVKFIMVSAYDHARFKEQSKDAGVSAYLAKPITASEVFNSIAQVSGRDVALYTPLAKLSDKLALAKHKLQGAHVLLVEDNELNQDLAIELLNSIGVSCELAENGKLAVEKLRHNSFDGVLMDIQMPVMDGYTATQKIREFDLEIAIIAMTANAMSGDRERVISAGMNDYISKPIDVEAMITTMAEWISASGLQPAAPVGSTEESVPSGITEGLNPEVIDQAAGLATCNGNANLYFKLLNKFSLNQRSFAEQFERACGESDWVLATRLVHTLKGNAGNIGALALQAAAAELEAVSASILSSEGSNSFKNSNERIQSMLSNISALLELVFQEIDLLMPKDVGQDHAEDDSQQQNNLAQLKTELVTLEEQLEECDVDAVERIDELSEMAFPAEVKKQLLSINKAAAEYDFEAASAKLKSLKTMLS
ncbi:transporter substrate-binding domain-containing protein [Agarivorans aestuarii]|uniref:histidine kinase n=1 Tax=Agarivorans aestuarii TaxID=1563703 RepID=A0ABU7G4N4_9ALTE|nr:transporter substrate-binding domain-containing protein [Agarivorans aestuarii]MEE1673954.1 transporter substrate-binding domain-containing protein [Agarivorans aestuarii]